ncbi:hypothetical protein MWU57_12615 [Isoptericola sp. S6320L]|uniref:hypothetical protein n=1 Tax=Isoptericola sp. S6320L TaxID=2926411 RepID=UPI001FF22F75|nr:hypothetical protein [Isoptericola sp. S6320L]MCK0117878.1 hypothetical protein [Isoptericola sp. S6320L]
MVRDQRSATPFLVALAMTTLSGSALIVLVPFHFRPPEPWLDWASWTAGVVALVSAAALLRLGPGGAR